MRLKQYLVGLCCFLLFGGCTLDDDSEFFPFTHQAFLLVQPESGSIPSFIGISNDQLTPDIGAQWGLSEVNLSDFAVEGSFLWLSSASENRLVQVDLETSEIEKTFDLGNFQPHYFQVGQSHVCLSDTLTQTLAFLDIRDAELIRRPLAVNPGIAAYRSRKFYVQLADSSIGIWQEQSFSEIARLATPGTIQSIQVDPSSTSTFVYTQNDSMEVEGFSINFNTDALNRIGVQAGSKKIVHSTIDSPRFGKEISGVGTLFTSGRFVLNAFTLEEVADIEVDFFDAQAYFIRAGELIRKNIQTGEERSLGSITGNFVQSGFYIDNIAN